MLIYLFIPLSFYILHILNLNDKNYSKLCILTIALVSTLRFNVGEDFSHYIEQIWLINNGLLYREIEISFVAIVKTINFLGLPDYFVISFYSILTAFFLFLNLEMVGFNRKFLYFWTFFPHLYLQSFNLIRLMLAVVIVWYAIQNIGRKKKYFLLIFLAMFFHITAIFGIVIYVALVYKIRLLAKLAILVIMFFMAENNLVNNLLQYTNYREVDDYNYDYRLFLVLLFFWVIFEIYNCKSFYKDLAFLSFITPLLFIIFNIQGDIMYRISYYSLIFIPIFLSTYKLRYNGIDMYLFFCVILLPLYFIYNLTFNGASFKLVPYNFLPLFEY